MSSTPFCARVPRFLLGVVMTAAAGSASALEFDVGDTTISLDNLFTVGGAWRMQDRDPSLIGKSNLQPGLCLVRTSGTPEEGPDPGGGNSFGAGAIGRVCSTSSPTGGGTTTISPENLAYVNAPGSFSPNGDDGNLQFDKYDLINAAAKLTTDVNFEFYDFNFFARGIVFFDQVYNDLEINHPDTTLQPAVTEYSDSAKEVNAFDIDLLDANVSRNFDVFDRFVNVKLGKQVLNWGESSLLFLNSLNTVNPPDANRARLPGFDLKEAFQPVGMLTINGDVIYNIGLEVFYQYEWTGLNVDPVGAFQSPADVLGVGGNFAMLSFGKAPEDPLNLYRAIDTCDFDPIAGTTCADALGLLGSTSGRTVYVTHTEPKDGGQYGLALRTFLEDFNNGTELNFYFANYHSRLPLLSAFAADRTCLDSTIGAPSLVTECGYAGPGNPTLLGEPVPVDTMRLMVEYPEDIKMYGVSFNTTIGDYALSGEYAFRPNLPTQIHTVDLTYTALQPAFPAEDINAGVATVPGRQSAFPTFLTRYRGLPCTSDDDCIQPGQYIRGYEELKTGQLNLTLLRLIGGDNPLGASQMTILFEMGATHVIDMPGLDEIQFNGGGTNTHISSGADGTQGIDPPGVPGNSGGNQQRDVGLMQNPTAHADHDGFGSDLSYGYRMINLNRWDSALFGANLETLFIVRHDVRGTAPGLGTNFTQGRKQFNLGLRWDYLSTWIGEVRYTWFTGGAGRDGERDKDNIFIYGGYVF